MHQRNSPRRNTVSQLLSPEIAHSDEREQATYHAGGALGMYIGMALTFCVALVFALFGHILVPMVLLVLAAIPSLITISYAEKRGVDPFAIIARGKSRAHSVSAAVLLVVVLLVAAAMFYTTWTGTGLLEFQVGHTWADRFSSASNGVAIGAGIGAVLGFLGAVWTVRKRRKQQQEELTAPDEE